MTHRHRDDNILFYESHLQEIQNYFHNCPHYLPVVCREDGDECREFMDSPHIPVPDIPFLT
jgi:hypothetical protein